jgi:hypothetical protein
MENGGRLVVIFQAVLIGILVVIAETIAEKSQ